jgi:hypothetical protein
VTALDPPVNTGEFQIIATAASTDATPMKAATFALYNEALPTSVRITSSSPQNRSTPGEAVTFTASVATAPLNPYDPSSNQPSKFGVPTGSVQFLVDGTIAGSETLDATGAARFTAPGLSAGLHTIKAEYLGDGRIFGPSASSLIQASGLDPVTMDVSSSRASVPFGTAVRFTAQVDPPANATDAPSGQVQFAIDGTERGGPVALGSDGSAVSPAISDLGVGLHTVVAHYLGDSNYIEGYATTPQNVQAASKVDLTTSSSPERSFTATVASATPGVTEVPQGTVTFVDNPGTSSAQPLGTVALVDGVATLDPSGGVRLCCMFNTVVATYNGEARFATSSDSVSIFELAEPPPRPAPDDPPHVKFLKKFLRKLHRWLRNL